MCIRDSHISVHEIKNKTAEKESSHDLIASDEKIRLKEKDLNDDIKAANNSNEQEFIYIKLSEEEKLVYSQLGINPLIKLGKEFIKVNNIPKLEQDGLKREKVDQSNEKKGKINKNSDNILADNFSNDDSDNKVDISNAKKIVNNEDIKENQDNEDPEITRRKRRRSSAGNE